MVPTTADPSAGDRELTSLFFDEAADHVQAQVTARNPAFTDRTKQLELYGFYKQATVGPCTTNKPGILDPAGRAKWTVWSKLGSLSTEAAKAAYVQAVQRLDPTWQPGATQGAGSSSQAGAKKGGMGPVFSAFAATAEDDVKDSVDCTVYELAAQGDCQGLSRMLAGGTPVDERDDVGCTPLHFAADRGCLDAMQLLIAAGADVNASDEDGQRPLHYAALCGHEEACRLLIKHSAHVDAKDEAGKQAKDISPPGWSVWQETGVAKS